MVGHLKCLIPTIGSPRSLNGKEGRYELAAFFGELLGMKVVNEGWLLIAEGLPTDGIKFFLALDGDGWSDERPPRWPDPEYPQQMHLDVLVPDAKAADALVTGMGASLLQDNTDFRVYADPVGHPFCLYPDSSTEKPVVGRVVFDCPSPRSLASFYEGFLQARGRLEDTPERVVIDLGDEMLPHLAFQHAQYRAARWPDPAYPAQMHVDYRWYEESEAGAALKRAERLGAIRLPQLADTEIYADPANHPFCIQNAPETP
ncbi:VOC family protein [Actinopolymorpha alba]|uniref:VOC family protein n=1 Tax=Actinopolymorpha alba TaxID=533267 RepID=UPI00037492E6|nr:VOC family protein [Actinopolymorpha alba]